jgi:pilus assembly protein Flp/PilA
MTNREIIERLYRDERGATAIEYGLIAALMVIAMMVTLQGVGNEVSSMWVKIGTTVDDANKKG